MKKLLQEARDVLLTCDAGKFDKGAEVIDALEAAIAQDDGEPVAWMDNDGNVSDNNDYNCFPIPLYAAPQVQPDSEPVAWMDKQQGAFSFMGGGKYGPTWTPLYAAPQVASDYVPLSDEQVIHLLPNNIPSMYDGELLKFARAIERAARGVK